MSVAVNCGSFSWTLGVESCVDICIDKSVPAARQECRKTGMISEGGRNSDISIAFISFIVMHAKHLVRYYMHILIRFVILLRLQKDHRVIVFPIHKRVMLKIVPGVRWISKTMYCDWWPTLCGLLFKQLSVRRLITDPSIVVTKITFLKEIAMCRMKGIGMRPCHVIRVPVCSVSTGFGEE